MGYDASAELVVGIKLNAGDFWKDAGSERGCEHRVTKAKHCSKCGKPMWVEGMKRLIDIPNLDEDSFFGGLIGDFDLERPNSEMDALFVGRKFDGRKNGSYDYPTEFKVDLPQRKVSEIKKALREFLEPYGLWDEKQFGFWVLLNESC